LKTPLSNRIRSVEVVKYVSKYRVIIALVLVTLLTVVLISACDIGATQRTVSQPPQFGILTPVENIKVLVNGPVQIQSAFDNPETISRVELWIDEPDPEPEKLLRSDVPAHGVVLQRWVPQQTGIHTLKVKAVRADNQVQQEFTRNIAVIAHQAISLAAEAGAGAFAAPEATMIWATPTLTPTATIEAAGVAFLPPAQVIATATPTPTPTPTPY
jgi:hypothetical protein